jgi:hypothetical protein
MKKFKINLNGSITLFIDNITFKIMNKNDAYLLTNSINTINIEFYNLTDAVNHLKNIYKEWINENKTFYKKSESYKIRLLVIDEFIIVDNIEILKVRPLITYYKQKTNKIFSIETQITELIKTYKITRLK